MERQADQELHSAVFRIESIGSKKNRFKIDKNAKDFHMRGLCIHTKDSSPDILIIEGGKVAVRRYSKLLLRRIQWR